MTRNGVLLKYDEPPDAALPDRKWRVHVFKGDAQLAVLPLHARSCYRFGRDPAVRARGDTDCRSRTCSPSTRAAPSSTPSCSTASSRPTSALVRTRRTAGSPPPPVADRSPYIIDLESTHGTLLNGSRLAPGRYVEVRTMDVVRFAASSREYVLLVEDQADGADPPRE